LSTGLTILETDEVDPVVEFAASAFEGLTGSPPSLPCRFLYDERGSELFEEICQQPEYYLTRAEASILQRHAVDIRDETGPLTLIELGSGTSAKTHHLLSAYAHVADDIRYVPVDVSESALRIAADNISDRHPTVEFAGIVGRYESAFPLFREHSPAMVLFLGSSIGNFSPKGAHDFWRQVSGSLELGDFILLGVDLVKDEDVLEAAYNDSAGVTAEFTKNIFARMNRELDAGVDLANIEHVAQYVSERQRVEISIRFLTDQELTIAPLDRTVSIRSGESVAIEISRKYVVEELRQRLRDYGLSVRRVFTDDAERFAVLLLRADKGGRKR
jgi:L-histidine N-alpha-methyltransferase